MKANHLLREVVNKTGGPIYMTYDLEESDPPMNWLFEGVSHECAIVWQLKSNDVLRPFKTKCGIHVTTHIEHRTAPLYNIVPVPTTCLACISGRAYE